MTRPAPRPSAPVPSAIPLKDVKVRLLRARFAALALTPILERGFDAVTTDELAVAAGVSRRTFFRYFATKEEVVISTFDEPGAALLAELDRRAAIEQPLQALRSTLEVIITTFGADVGRARATLDLIRRTPTLRGHFLVIQDDWIDQLAGTLRARMPKGPEAAIQAQLTARVAIAAIDTALAAWAERPNEDLRAIAGATFDALGAVVQPAVGRKRKA